MHKRHFDSELYFTEQSYTSEKFIIPYLKKNIKISPELSVLEIGCGLGGNLKPFMDLDCKVIGIDMNRKKIEFAKYKYKDHHNFNNLRLINSDIYDINIDDLPKFDLILLKDTIEHIHNQEVFLKLIKNLLNSKGKIFIAFPPWRMPFGGHQQICKNKLLANTPFFHLLPKKIYKFILKLFGEKNETINSLLEIKNTRLHINKFNEFIKRQNLTMIRRTFYVINPNFKIKFGINPIKLPHLINIPYLRDFFITTCYYVLIKS